LVEHFEVETQVKSSCFFVCNLQHQHWRLIPVFITSVQTEDCSYTFFV
jgi:hypothetical protein